MKTKIIYRVFTVLTVFATIAVWQSCKPKAPGSVTMGDAASRAYVAPGKYDEFYNVVSGGFNGQMSIYGLPSGRLFRIIPVFSQFPENGWGYSEESKPMLNTSHGFVPWMICTTSRSQPPKASMMAGGLLATPTTRLAWPEWT